MALLCMVWPWAFTTMLWKLMTASAMAVPYMRTLSPDIAHHTAHDAVTFFLFFLSPHLLSSSSRKSFTLNDLLDKTWSQVSSVLPPSTCLHFYRVRHSHLSALYARRFSSLLLAN